MPEMNELTLDEPEIIKQGGKYGVRLKSRRTCYPSSENPLSTPRSHLSSGSGKAI